MSEAEVEEFIKLDIDHTIVKFAAGKKKVTIEDTNYKPNRRNNINFSTNYLSLTEELSLMLNKHYLIYKRNLKLLVFIFISPIIFLAFLGFIQTLTERYTKSMINKNPTPINIDDINLKCDFSEGCLSLGVAVIVKIIIFIK